MRRRPLILGIDLGTSSVKVLVVDLEGRVVGRGEGSYPIHRPGPGRAEQAPAGWWASMCEATAAALRSVPGPRAGERVAAIGLDGQMHGTVLLDREGEPLRDAVIWLDQRSAEQVAELTATLGREAVIAAVGGPLATGFQAPTVSWLRRHEPERWERAAAVCCPKDWVRYRLTAELATDPSDGSGTGLLDARSRSWWAPMLEAVGVEPGSLPRLRDATDVAGPLLAAAAADLGVRPGIPVAVGAGDTPAGLLGAGLVGPDGFLVALSTGGQVAVPALEPSPDPLGRSHTFCGALPPARGVAGWYRMGGILSAGAALRWLRDEVLVLEEPEAYARMSTWADAVPPGSNGLLFLPYLAGERSPHMDPGARGSFVGLTSRHGRAELIRSVMEGVALACLDAALGLGAAVSLPGTLVLAGGGVRSPVWSRIVADVFGRTVRRLATEEQAASGACVLGAAAAGLVDPVSAARRWAALGQRIEPIEPDAASHRRYLELFELFREAHRSAVGIEHRLAQLATR